MRGARKRDTRERLLEEGVAVFLQGGYHGTGIKEILDRVKVPKGSFYNYFESKDAFGAAAIRHYAECLSRKMEEATEGTADPLSGLRIFFEGLIEEFRASNFMGGCLVVSLVGELEGSDICHKELAQVFMDWRNAMRDLLRQAQEQGLVRKDMDAGELADILVEAWEGAVIRMKVERTLEPLQRCLNRLLDGYFRG